MPLQVIVADDDKLFRSLVSIIVKDTLLLEHHIHCVENGGEAKALLKTITPDLVITDIEMPLMNGYELTIYLKSSKQAPFVIVTSGSGDENLQLAATLGPDEVIDKTDLIEQALVKALTKFERDFRQKQNI